VVEPPTAQAAVIDASPLIFLARSHHLDLLQAFSHEVWVPEPVAEEILRRGAQDFTAQAIEHTTWFVIVLVAKQRGLIPKARPVIEDMMSAGLYLSRKVSDHALRRVGE